MPNTIKVLQQLLDGLMSKYKQQVPDVNAIVELMIKEKLISKADEIENDHIAFRTLGLKHLGIQSLEKIFLHLGYEKKESFHFEKKKLDAFWYAPPSEKFPRIFISELLVPQLSQKAQDILHRYTQDIHEDPVNQLDLDNPQELIDFLHAPLWPTPYLEDYETLQKESEYASWVIYNRFYLNHFTISVHNLKKHSNLKSFVEFLEEHGFKINDAGGKVKTSPDQKLIQGSTIAAKEKVEFECRNGEKVTRSISTSFVEFAERRILDAYKDLPQDQVKREHRRDGFEAANADSIFESTYNDQTKKRSFS